MSRFMIAWDGLQEIDVGACYECNITEIFREIRRVLRDDGTVWLNIGDSYAQSGGSGLWRIPETA